MLRVAPTLAIALHRRTRVDGAHDHDHFDGNDDAGARGIVRVRHDRTQNDGRDNDTLLSDPHGQTAAERPVFRMSTRDKGDSSNVSILRCVNERTLSIGPCNNGNQL